MFLTDIDASRRKTTQSIGHENDDDNSSKTAEPGSVGHLHHAKPQEPNVLRLSSCRRNDAGELSLFQSWDLSYTETSLQ